MNVPSMSIPEVHSYAQILARVRERVSSRGKVRAAMVMPGDLDMLKACAQAVSEGLIELSIVGESSVFERFSREEEIELPMFQCVDVHQPEHALKVVADLAFRREIDLIIKGRLLTSDLLTGLFRHEAQFVSKGTTISHVAVLKPQKYEKLIMLTDGAVVVEPNLQAKIGLIQNLIVTAAKIGITKPRIGLLAAVEVVYPQMPVTMESAVIAKMADRGQIKGAFVDGPLSFDVAIDMFAAHAKGVHASTVAGQADALVAPNIESANGVYKAMALYGHCEMGGVIVGGRVPIALGSRSDTFDSKFNSIALGVLSV